MEITKQQLAKIEKFVNNNQRKIREIIEKSSEPWATPLLNNFARSYRFENASKFFCKGRQVDSFFLFKVIYFLYVIFIFLFNYHVFVVYKPLAKNKKMALRMRSPMGTEVGKMRAFLAQLST